MFNAAGVLERSFTPIEGGYLFYPTRWSPGYLVTPDEYEQLTDDWRRVAGWKGMLKLVGWIVLAMAVSAALALYFEVNELFFDLATYGLVAIFAGYILWKGTAVNRLVRGRQAAVPPRSSTEAELDMGKALGRPLAVWIAFVSLCFVGWAGLFAATGSPWAIALALFAIVVAFFNIRVAIRAFRSKG